MIKEIRPEIIIPIHTLEPHKFKELGKKVIIPKKDEKIEIK
jgi:mRNA degradation ribonuclease J1/J2